MRSSATPGLALRLTAVAAAIASLLAVVSGATGGGAPHRELAALALPPLLALVLAAWYVHRRLLVPTLVPLLFFLAAAAWTGNRPLHVALAALAFAAAVVLAALTLRGERTARGSLRDYVTLTKPRIMTLLLLTGACGMVVGARGLPPVGRFGAMMLGLALACGGASALNHLLDRDIDRLMGSRTEGRPVATGRLSPPRALEFGLALSACSFVLL
ncbi:MAG TPA: UbiA family prenyltransferase, partial [Gaiellaceae bacterium]